MSSIRTRCVQFRFVDENEVTPLCNDMEGGISSLAVEKAQLRKQVDLLSAKLSELTDKLSEMANERKNRTGKENNSRSSPSGSPKKSKEKSHATSSDGTARAVDFPLNAILKHIDTLISSRFEKIENELVKKKNVDSQTKVASSTLKARKTTEIADTSKIREKMAPHRASHLVSNAKVCRGKREEERRLAKAKVESPLNKRMLDIHRRVRESPAARVAEDKVKEAKKASKSAGETKWTKVVGRKAKSAASSVEITRSEKSNNNNNLMTKASSRTERINRTKKETPKLAKVPKTAAVVITVPVNNADSKVKSYAEAMAAARQRVKLEEIGIQSVKPKKARTGGLILEITGESNEAKAAILAEKLRAALSEDGVTISTPTKKGEVRLHGIEDSISKDEVLRNLATIGECAETDIKTGPLRRTYTGLNTVWVQCPIAAARKIAEKGKITIGWTTVKVQILNTRKEACYKCWGSGHVAQTCTALEDRSELCYRCARSTTNLKNEESKNKDKDKRLNGLQKITKFFHKTGDTTMILKDNAIPSTSKGTSGGEKIELATGGISVENRFAALEIEEENQEKEISQEEINANHAAKAHDLIISEMKNRKIELVVIAEPYRILESPYWIGDTTGKVAIAQCTLSAYKPITPLVAGNGFVAVNWCEWLVMAIYAPPSWPISKFEHFLGELDVVLNDNETKNRPVLVLGDFNAHAAAWSSRNTTEKGHLVLEWASAARLILLNKGAVATCSRPQGESIVDISFGNILAARKIADWRAAAIAATWTTVDESPINVEKEVDDPMESLSSVCDTCMPRIKSIPQRRPVYWWTEGISKNRAECTLARRQYKREKGRKNSRSEEKIKQLCEKYKSKKNELKLGISEPKSRSWEQLRSTLQKDPWGRPYKIVMDKLRPWAPPITETMSNELPEEVVDSLFPRGDTDSISGDINLLESFRNFRDINQEVTMVDIARAVQKLKKKCTAPGPDGIPGRFWTKAIVFYGPRLQRIYTECLQTGKFPKMWKTGKMVLLNKPGRPANSPSAYRPIVLLDEVGKIFERIIQFRLVQHLKSDGPDLADCQFGFREGRSTIDAIRRVKSIAEAATEMEGIALAVSLDIKNAFNSLSWAIIYRNRDGKVITRITDRGVPQGSVLAPLLWNIGYNGTLCESVPPRVHITCYADDTMLLSIGKSKNGTISRAEVGIAAVTSKFLELGLQLICRQDGSSPFRKRIRKKKELKLRAESKSSRLMPNFGGSNENVRRLYASVVRSIAMYGSPIWCSALTASKKNINRVKKPWRRIAIRVIRGYKTISYDAAIALAGMAPIELLAEEDSYVYDNLRGVRRGPNTRDLRADARKITMTKWKTVLSRHTNHWTIGALCPIINKWLQRRNGALSFRMTQIFTERERERTFSARRVLRG
ncbi:uncharacterized protein LOC143431873 [Xylocopa sonorina]|uniref:uncharacterized protein LOC143431873 n=1 Tax=Xylocopa sonorina TaxID=1818115 RepID=UPI00403A8E07